jgi:hypothetical protein
MVTLVFLNNCVKDGGFGPGTILHRITYHRKSHDTIALKLVETYQFLCFLGLNRLTGWVSYWAPTQTRSCSSASCCWEPPPWHQYPQHTIGNECTSWFGAICPLWQAPVPFLKVAKLFILSCQCLVAIDAFTMKSTPMIPNTSTYSQVLSQPSIAPCLPLLQNTIKLTGPLDLHMQSQT